MISQSAGHTGYREESITKRLLKSRLTASVGTCLCALSLMQPGYAAVQTNFIPIIPFNMETGAISVPYPGSNNELKTFDVGQVGSIPVTVTAQWMPSTSTSNGLLRFRSDGAALNCYLLTITKDSVSISSRVNGVDTGLGSCAYALAGKPFRLIEDQNAFTIMDGQTQVLQVTDSAIANGQGIQVGTNTNGQGAWQLAVSQHGVKPVCPALGDAVLRVPDLDQDNRHPQINTAGTPLVMVNHFGIPHSNCALDINFSSMIKPSKVPGTELGMVTLRRQFPKNQGIINDYELHICSDQLVLVRRNGKPPQDPSPTTIAKATISPALEKMTKLPLRIVQENVSAGVRIRAFNRVTGGQPLFDVTDSTTPAYQSGYQFGLYTPPGAFNCWDQVHMVPQ